MSNAPAPYFIPEVHGIMQCFLLSRAKSPPRKGKSVRILHNTDHGGRAGVQMFIPLLDIAPLASAGAGQVVKEEMTMTSQGLSVTYGPGCLLLAQRYWEKRKHLTDTLLSGMDWDVGLTCEFLLPQW